MQDWGGFTAPVPMGLLRCNSGAEGAEGVQF